MSGQSERGDEAVEIVEYRDEWPMLFEAERRLLLAELGVWVFGEVQHIGSTAVQAMAAKPVIDIMFPVRSLEASKDAIAAAGKCGYKYWPYKPDVMHWFCKPSPARRTHHLHIVPYGSTLWFERLAFRDMLRNNALIAAEYATLKRSLAEKFRNDREGYTNGKSQFIARAVSSAIRET